MQAAYLLALFLVIIPGALSTEDVSSSVDFNNRPSVPSSYRAMLDNVVCSFTYESVGGSSEIWNLRVESVDTEDRSRMYRCIVERPEQSSYLVFLSYKLEVTGGQIKDATVVDGELKPLFPDNNFVVQKKKKGVLASVSSDPNFKGVISGLSVDIQASKK